MSSAVFLGGVDAGGFRGPGSTPFLPRMSFSLSAGTRELLKSGRFWLLFIPRDARAQVLPTGTGWCVRPTSAEVLARSGFRQWSSLFKAMDEKEKNAFCP